MNQSVMVTIAASTALFFIPLPVSDPVQHWRQREGVVGQHMRVAEVRAETSSCCLRELEGRLALSEIIKERERRKGKEGCM